MSRPTQPLPLAFDGRPFTLRAATDAGVSRQRLRHPSLLVPTRGLRTPESAGTVGEAAAAVSLVLAEPWAFSHETAAELLGLPVPRGWAPGRPLHVMRPDGCGPVRRPGVRGHRGLQNRSVVRVAGMPVVDLGDTWCDVSTHFGLVDLVVAGDAALGLDGLTVDALAGQVRERRGHRGARVLGAALPLLRVGSGSPMESKARLAFADGGLPEPELNADILDDGGGWIACGDFVWREARVVVEYEGDGHRTDRQQWLVDVARTQLLEDAGWQVIRITARDLSAPQLRARMVARIRRALSARSR